MGAQHKAAICRAASAAAGQQMQEFVDDGLTTEDQDAEVIAAHEHHVHTLTDIAAAIPDRPSDDDD